MAIRGPKPKSGEQRRREGNPGKRPVPKDVVVGGDPPPEFALNPPEWLDNDAKAWWTCAVPVLQEVGLLDVVDVAALEMAASAYARFRQARRVIDEEGVMSTGSTGQIVEHPMLATERQSQAQYLRFAEQYALTPVARTRLGLAELHAKSLAEEMNAKMGQPDLKPVESTRVDDEVVDAEVVA
jgi:P27 family predicted phage terminase small subunit